MEPGGWAGEKTNLNWTEIANRSLEYIMCLLQRFWAK